MTTYYVQEDGDNGNAGTSKGAANAWADPGYASGQITSGDIVYVKSGTYTLDNTTAGSAGGPVLFGTLSVDAMMVGYEVDDDDGCPTGDRPVFAAGSQSPSYMMKIAGADRYHQLIANFDIDCNDKAVLGIDGSSQNTCEVHNCIVRNATTAGFDAVKAISCKSIDAAGYGFQSSAAYYCVAEGGGRGFYTYTNGCMYCIANGCTQGFYRPYRELNANCVAYDCSGDGFEDYQNTSAAAFINCVSIKNGGFGFDGHIGSRIINCAVPAAGASGIANTLGNFDETPMYQSNLLELTVDPFVDGANGDFRLNQTAGGGLVLRAAGLGVFGQQNNVDVGAVASAKQYLALLQG